MSANGESNNASLRSAGSSEEVVAMMDQVVVAEKETIRSEDGTIVTTTTTTAATNGVVAVKSGPSSSTSATASEIGRRLTDSVLGQLTSTGTLQNDTAEKLRTFLATAATAASELEVSDSTRAEAQQMQQELLVKGNQVVDTLREDEELMDLVSTLSDTFAQKGLKGLDGSVKMSQVKAIVERLKKKDIFQELIAKGQNAYNELQATDLDQDPHALAGAAMARLAGRDLTASESALLQQGQALLRELESSPTFQQLKKAVLKIIDKLRVKFEEFDWDAFEKEDRAISTDLLEGAEERFDREVEEFKMENKEILDMMEEMKPVVGEIMESALRMLCEYLPNVTIPRVNGYMDSNLGNICFHLAELKISSIDLKVDSVSATFPTNVMAEGGSSRSTGASYVAIKDIDASLEGFRWQFGKMSFPFVGDDGRASVRVKGLSITVEYDLRFEGKSVVLEIRDSKVDLKDLDVQITDAKGESSSTSVLYSLIVSMLNKKLCVVLRQQLQLLMGDQVGAMADKASELTMGMVNVVSLLDTAPEQDDNFDCHHKLHKCDVGQVQIVDSISIGHVLSPYSLPATPKVFLFSAKLEPSGAIYELSRMMGDSMVFCFVGAKQTYVQQEFGFLDRASLPVLMCIPHADAKPQVCRQVLNPTNIRNFLEPFYFRNDRVLVLTENNIDALLTRPMPHVVVTLCTKGDPAEVPAVLSNLAKVLSVEIEPPVLVCMVKASEQKVLAKLKVDQLPRVLFMPPASAKLLGGSARHATDPVLYHMPGNTSGKVIMEEVAKFKAAYKKSVVVLTQRNFEWYLVSRPKKYKVILNCTHPKCAEQSLRQEQGHQTYSDFRDAWKSHGKKVIMAVIPAGAEFDPIRRVLGFSTTEDGLAATAGKFPANAAALAGAFVEDEGEEKGGSDDEDEEEEDGDEEMGSELSREPSGLSTPTASPDAYKMASVQLYSGPLQKKEIAAFVKKYAKTKVPRHYRKGLPSKPRPFKG